MPQKRSLLASQFQGFLMRPQSPDTWWVIHFHFKSTGPCQQGNSSRASLNVRPLLLSLSLSTTLLSNSDQHIPQKCVWSRSPLEADLQVWSSHVLSRKKWADHVLLLERWVVSSWRWQEGQTDEWQAGVVTGDRSAGLRHLFLLILPALHYSADRWHEAPHPLQSIPRTHTLEKSGLDTLRLWSRIIMQCFSTISHWYFRAALFNRFCFRTHVFTLNIKWQPI